jgi:restriction endonuclease
MISHTTINLRKEYILKPESKTLWEKIKNKTRYYVTLDTGKIIDETLGAKVDEI